MASYNKDIDYAAEVKRIRALDPTANVNALLEAGLAKSKAEYGGKYAPAWERFYQEYYTQPVQTPQYDILGEIERAKQARISSTPQYDILGEIERAKQARISSRIAALEGLRSKTKNALAAEKSQIPQRYYDIKNQESATAKLMAKRISDIMASRGYSSGAQAQNMLTQNVGLQNILGSLERQKQGALDDIARRETDTDIAYETGIEQARADADTWAAEKTLAELATLRDYGREDQRYADTRSDILYNRAYQLGRDAIADERYEREFDLKKQQADLSLKSMEIQNQLAQLQLEAFPEEQRLRIQQLQKQIAQIGKEPYRTEEEIELDKIKLEQARLELDKLKNSQSTAPLTVEDFYKNILDMKNAVQKQYDQYGNVVGEGRKYDDAYIRDYILGLPLSDEEIAYLLSAAGIPKVQGPSQFGQ